MNQKDRLIYRRVWQRIKRKFGYVDKVLLQQEIELEEERERLRKLSELRNEIARDKIHEKIGINKGIKKEKTEQREDFFIDIVGTNEKNQRLHRDRTAKRTIIGYIEPYICKTCSKHLFECKCDENKKGKYQIW